MTLGYVLTFLFSVKKLILQDKIRLNPLIKLNIHPKLFINNIHICPVLKKIVKFKTILCAISHNWCHVNVLKKVTRNSEKNPQNERVEISYPMLD